MFQAISRAALAAALCLIPLVALAQQGPGVGPLSGGPRLDDRRLQDLQRPELPLGRGTLPVNRSVGCTFYEHADYEGRSRKYTVIMGVKPDILYVREVAYVGDDFNDMISGFKCDDGCEADLYADRDFQGDSLLGYFFGSRLGAPNGVKGVHLNDRTSSLKVNCHLY